VPGVENRTRPATTLVWGALAGTYLVAALVGFVLGGHFPRSTSTALTRVGLALRQGDLQATPEAWSALGADVDTVRWQFSGGARDPEREQARQVFDLVVAVRGLKSDGSTDWAEAEQLCRALEWPRCDRPALEELKSRSRP
jgi:hypothetical protein